MAQVPSVPSYWTQRRRIIADVAAFWENSRQQTENESSCPSATDLDTEIDVNCCVVETVSPSNDDYTVVDDIDERDEVGRDSDDDYDHDHDNDDDSSTTADADDCDLSHFLVQWAAQFEIPQIALSVLLRFLHRFHPDLPLDSRTVCKTPRNTMTKKLHNGGEYIHFGVKHGVEELVKCGELSNVDHLKLQFNVDGLPLFKSSGMCIWPILCLVLESSSREPFVVGIYCGPSKPTDLPAFLSDFVSECSELVATGISLDDRVFTVELNSFVCDAPARAMMKNVKSHGGYYACDKCTQEGEWCGKVVYPECTAPLRTNIHFNEMTDDEHHLGPTPLSSLPIGMVTGFPLDYMHLVCLGVMRRLLLCWLKGPLAVRLCSRKVEQLKNNLLKMIPFIPREFSRKPRSVGDLLRWKATELRQFLLYTGPVALLDVLPEPLYKNFLLLCVGITLLINPNLCEKYCDYAKGLLITCVENMKVLYGKGMLVYNVHGLVHLADDAQLFGPLDNFSAFPFENKLKSVKRLVRKPSFVLQQIARRLHERSTISNVPKCNNNGHTFFKKEHFCGPLLPGMECAKQYKVMCLRGSTLTLNVGDDCVAKSDGEPCIVRNILCIDGSSDPILVVENFESVLPFFDYPLRSSSIHIYKVIRPNGVLDVISASDVLCKCVRLPLNDESFAVFALLHTV